MQFLKSFVLCRHLPFNWLEGKFTLKSVDQTAVVFLEVEVCGFTFLPSHLLIPFFISFYFIFIFMWQKFFIYLFFVLEEYLIVYYFYF